MPDLVITAIQGTAQIHGRTYPMFTGFATPNQLIDFSSVPSFHDDTQHVRIANLLKDPPIDHWQRPLDTDRVGRIRSNINRANPRDGADDCLMANPVLLGKSDKLNQEGVNLQIEAMMQGGRVVPNVYTITLSGTDEDKPLWILDGQHRIHGLGNSPLLEQPNGSLNEDQEIPVVFVISEIYTPQFLAKIFTEVTTEAVKMHELHGDWMQYSFNMGDYRTTPARRAMEVVIELTTTQNLDGEPNPFFSGVKFNPSPELNVNRVRSMDEWRADHLRKFIQTSYYSNVEGQGGEPVTVATSLVRFLRAAVESDHHSEGESKLLGTISPRPKLAEEFFSRFLQYLGTDLELLNNTKEDWIEFLNGNHRRFDLCDWRLRDIGTSSTTGTAYGPSSHAASVTFDHFFNNPENLGGRAPSSYLTGPGSILIEFAMATDAGRFPRRNVHSNDLQAQNGEHPINIREDGYNMVRFKGNPRRQVSVIEVEIYDAETNQWIRQERTATAIALSDDEVETQIRVTTLCYSADSRRVDTVTIMH